MLQVRMLRHVSQAAVRWLSGRGDGGEDSCSGLWLTDGHWTLAIITGILHRRTDGTVITSAFLPVSDDLTGRSTVWDCKAQNN